MSFEKKERNVVILGKVGSGKRTLGNHIAGTAIFQPGSVLGARKVDHFYKTHEGEDGTLYKILIVDTEGLQARYKDPMPLIKKLEKVHLIIFVIANGRYTDESQRSLNLATNSTFRRANSLCALVITHCEDFAEEQRRHIVAEFKDDVRTTQVTALMGKGVHTVGFPDTSELPPELTKIYESGVDSDEKFIRKLVDDCNDGLNVSALQGFEQDRGLHYNQPSASHFQQASLHPREASSFQQPFDEDVEASSGRQDALEGPLEDLSPHNSQPLVDLSPHNSQPTLPTDLGSYEGTRTVILLGSFGTGKRTLVNHIADQEVFKTGKVFTTTREIEHYGRFVREGILYRILTIDTDTLFTDYNNPLPRIQQKFQSVNLIIFVIANGRYTDESHGALMNVVKNLSSRAAPLCALVITYCEGIEASSRQDIVANIKGDHRFERIAAFMGKEMYTVGFPNLSSTPLFGKAKETLEKGIAEDEERLRELVEKSKEFLPVASLQAELPSVYERNPSTVATTKSRFNCLQQ